MSDIDWRLEWKRLACIPILSRLRPIVEVPVWGGRRMRIDLRDRVISRTLYLYGQYEAELQLFMGNIGLERSVCVDIGANIGLHTLALSDLVRPPGQVFAYEPEIRNFRLLEENLRLNGAANVTARPCAVGDHEGTCRLEVSAHNYGDHRIATEGAPASASSEVPIVTLDADLREVPDGAIRLIKIDVQGHEYQVIRGMTATLKRNPDAVLMLEIFPDALRAAGASALALMELLRDIGFTGWEFHAHRVLPVAEPWVYELIRDGRDVNLILSQNGDVLWRVLSTLYGRPLPPVPSGA